MKNVAVLVVASLIFGCTTLRPIAGQPEQIQEQILAGQLVVPGDRVRVTARDGSSQSFRVTEVGPNGELIGKDGHVAVGDIVALEKRRTSWVKTGLLVGLLSWGLLGTRCTGDPCGPYGEGFYCCP